MRPRLDRILPARPDAGPAAGDAVRALRRLGRRQGDLREGREAAMKLIELDPTDKIGARLLIEVLDKAGQDDD